jgi:regulator of nucleoside diphosphate kinase
MTPTTSEEPILITEQDHSRLTSLLRSADPSEVDQHLVDELERANIVPSSEIPPDVVTMNSRVTFIDEATGGASSVQLVYPHDADPTGGKLSVFAPIGAALLGLSVGQSIQWALPNGRTRTVRVTSVTYQPEAAGDWEL